MTQLQRAPCPHKTAGSHLAKGPREALATLGALVPAAVDNSQGVSSDAALVHRHRKNRREALLPQRRRATKHGGRRESGGECKEERANCREQSYTRHHSSGLERTWPPVRFQEGLLYHSHALVLFNDSSRRTWYSFRPVLQNCVETVQKPDFCSSSSWCATASALVRRPQRCRNSCLVAVKADPPPRGA